jgi:hypothetical protein
VKRIIFSQFNDNVDQNHKSTNDYKLNQFRTYSDKLRQSQQLYADRCGAEYVLHETNTTDYNTLQFEKILKLEEYAKDFDQVLYLDFDVVPNTRANNIFDVLGNTLAIYPLKREMTDHQLKWAIENDTFDNQNVYCKTCAKNSMLILNDCPTSNKLYNTGVTYGGSETIKQLRFGEQLDDMKNLLDEATNDSLYPDAITKNFYYNNEVFITYLIERDSLSCIDLNIQWNFILDGYQPNPSDVAFFVHHVNKEFEKSFG